MKLKPIKRIFAKKGRRLGAVALTFFILVWFGFALSAAQTSSGKRILSVQVSDSTEGARVTVIADLALSDYEAFRRGDRFCVRIPAGALASPVPRLRGNGFVFIEIQHSGDSLILSFKLQPGASARVDQKFNRLDVVFSPLARSDTSTANSNVATQTTGNAGVQYPGRRAEERPGERSGVTGTPAGAAAEQRTVVPSAPVSTGNTTTNAQSGSGATPNPISGVAGSNSTPIVSGSTSRESSPTQSSERSSPSRTQPISSPSQTGSFSQNASQWLSANRPLALIGLLLLLGLLMLLGAWIRRWRQTSNAERWKDEKIAPTSTDQVTNLMNVPGGWSSSSPISQETAQSGTTPDHTEVIEGITPDAPVTSQEPATPETLEKPPAPASISHPREAKEVIVEPPFSNTPGQFERTDFEIKKLLAGREYDANLIDVPDSPTRQVVAASLLAALAGYNLEQHERARKAFVDHGYFDETTRDLRTADSPTERSEAARKLGIVGDALGSAYLIAALYDTAPEVRLAAVESLGQIGDASAISPLNDLLAREKGDQLPESVIRHAINSITVTTVTDIKRVPDADSAALRVVEKPAEADQRMEANDAFMQFIDTLNRQGLGLESLVQVAPESSAVPPPVVPAENESSSADEELNLQREEEALRRAADELERRRLEAGAARQKAEEEARLKAESEAHARAEIESRIRAEDEARRRAEEEALKRKAEEEALIRAEQEARARAEEEARTRAQEEAQFRLEAETLRRAAEELARKRAEAELARKRAEEEARLRAEEEARRVAEEEARRLAEQQALRRAEDERLLREAEERRRMEEQQLLLEQEALIKAADEVARRRREVAEARKQAEEEAQLLLVAQEQLRAEEQERRRVEEERQQLEAEARRRAEEERRRFEEARRRAVEEQKRIEEETRRQAEEEERRLAELESARREAQEQALHRAEEEKRRLTALETLREEALEQARQRAEQEKRIKAEIESLHREEEEQRQRIEAEKRRRAEAEARLREEQARRQAEEEARVKAEQEAREAEEARIRAAEEARLRAELEARQRAEEEARLRAEEEARQRAEQEARQRAEQEARQRAEEEARLRAEEEARQRAEEEARQRAEEEARQRAEEEARARAEEQARIRREEEEERQRIEEEVYLRAEAEARAADDARVRAEEARLRAEGEARQRAEEDARQRAEEKAFGLAEEKSRASHEQSPIVHDQAGSLRVEATSAQSSTSAVSGSDLNEVASPATQQRDVATDSVHPVSNDDPAGIDVVRSEKGIGEHASDAEISAELLKRLESTSSAERSSALVDLARVGGEEAFRFISRAFEDQSEDVRNTAVRALYDLQSDRAASFTRALREGTADRRRRIGAALAASGLASEAIANLTGESREKTYDAFSLLFLMAKAGEVQPLMKAIEDYPNLEVRLAVVKLLALCGQPEIVPAFRRLAVRGSLPSEVRSAVMEAIYQISSQTRETTPSAA